MKPFRMNGCIMNHEPSANFEDNRKLFHGFEIGSVAFKWARGKASGQHQVESFRHEGDPKSIARRILYGGNRYNRDNVVVTGQAARSLLDFPYRAEAECLERALAACGLQPDLLLSLGGENFLLYTMKKGMVRNIVSTSKCAAGTGEFMVQQFQRMGLSLAEGISESRQGRLVRLSTRCSVYCKSDATHKLNKKECHPRDIARTLVYDLADRVVKMIDLTPWPRRTIVLSGGMVRNLPFVERVRERLEESDIIVIEESPCLEAYGAMLFAADNGSAKPSRRPPAKKQAVPKIAILPPLAKAGILVDYRVQPSAGREITADGRYFLGLDAGSTTTKAVLFNVDDGSVAASCYLRTHGNPVMATRQCLKALIKQTGKQRPRIVQAATTGSGRKITSVFLQNCLHFNEIMAHARAAVQEVPDVDTVFEIGGQDAKYISFQNGIPMDYAMNEGCSAGTGSFLEEAAGVDMGIDVKQISDMALNSHSPLAFGERCAAFINTDLRNALQQGAGREDVIGGLVYSIAKNYLSRIVGVRQIGEQLLFQGGVALNRSVAVALAILADRTIVVPRHPELMGCIGACLLARDRILEGNVEEISCDLHQLVAGSLKEKSAFRCTACENSCHIVNFEVHGETFPFGGSCSKYERIRRKQPPAHMGQNRIALRNALMFETFGPEEVVDPRGTVGIPLALSTYAFFPFYARLINRLGFNVVLSEPSIEGNAKTKGPICYPGELAHGAVDDLLQKKVDYIFMPHVIEGPGSVGNMHSYICSTTAIMPHILREAFVRVGQRLLSPQIAFTRELYPASVKQIEQMGRVLKISSDICTRAAGEAYDWFRQYQQRIWKETSAALAQYGKRPVVVLAGRPYIVCSAEANLALPGMVIQRGYHVVGSDMLPPLRSTANPRDVWYHTQQIMNAVAYARRHPNIYLVLVSCFSCIPDASMYHVIREALSGRVFCYLEIDSHTAHSGFETRVEAFLDIAEAAERKTANKNRSDPESISPKAIPG